MWILVVLSFVTALVSTATLNRYNRPNDNTLINTKLEQASVDAQIYLSRLQAYINSNSITANTVISNSSILSSNVTPGITYTLQQCGGSDCFVSTVGNDGKTIFVTVKPGYGFSPSTFDKVSQSGMVAGKKSGNNLVTNSLSLTAGSFETLAYTNLPTAWSGWADGTSVIVITKG